MRRICNNRRSASGNIDVVVLSILCLRCDAVVSLSFDVASAPPSCLSALLLLSRTTRFWNNHRRSHAASRWRPLSEAPLSDVDPAEHAPDPVVVVGGPRPLVDVAAWAYWQLCSSSVSIAANSDFAVHVSGAWDSSIQVGDVSLSNHVRLHRHLLPHRYFFRR